MIIILDNLLTKALYIGKSYNPAVVHPSELLNAAAIDSGKQTNNFTTLHQRHKHI